MGNICGRYKKYKKLLKDIGLKMSDELYVVGDIIGEDTQSVSLLRDMSLRSNVFPILGDREYKALKNRAESEFMNQISRLEREQSEGILEYLGELVLYERVDVGNSKYLLVHNFEQNKTLESIVKELGDISDMIIVSAHDEKGDRISRCDNRIYLNCGESENSPLCVLCLDDKKEYYA